MYPTMFKLPFLPAWMADVKSYGVMMTIAFLSGVWMACRRAMKCKANPDTVLNMGLISLVAGVLGARAMFVLHYWETRFANQPNPLWAVIDLRAGGLEFWGGPLLVIPTVMIYLRFIAKVSMRWYLDITAPSLAWGLAITRVGCFLNGCCWGGMCLDPQDAHRQRAAIPWAVHFPYGSPAMIQQFRFGQMTIPKELICTPASDESFPIPREYLELAAADGGKTGESLRRAYEDASAKLREAEKAKADDAQLQSLQRRMQAARSAHEAHLRGSTGIGLVDQQCRRYGISQAELLALSKRYGARPVHPAQLYEMIAAFLICWFMTMLFYYRRRHGVVLPWFLILYSIARVLLEAIRQDNPLDVGGLTISQAISVGTFLTGLLGLAVIYLRLPPVSPRAVPFEWDTPPAARPAQGPA